MNLRERMQPDAAVDWLRVREDFPILRRSIHGKPLVYLDSANTAQKPRQVIEAVDRFYREHNANVSRAVHQLGEEATALYEGARDKLAAFLGASHRAKIVPWQLVCGRAGAHLKVAPITESGELVVEKFVELLTPEVKLAGVVHVSNVLGTVNPVKRLARECRKRGIPLLVDGSQAAPHLALDVKSIGCDFYVITGHKMCGPTGTGALWARRELLETMPPFFGGGEMIREVKFSGTTFADPPHKFEAGTPNTAGFAGLAAAVDYLQGIGMANIAARERELLDCATRRLNDVPGLRIIGHAPDKAAVISFLIDGVHAHDLATLLDQEGVAVRSGHHCAHPLMQFYGVAATCRVSLAFWNTEAEIDALVEAISRARELLA